tara:strand:- start:165 stop:653 length:489 start_codon:yes stop_codon:yes gene_type:complete
MNKIQELITTLSKTLPKFKDGRIDYSNSVRAPVINVFIKYKENILLLKRSDKVNSYQDKWNCVGGYLDDFQPLKDKVLEEIHEELNIQENIIKNIIFGEIHEFHDPDINKTWIIQPILVELKENPKIKLDWEHTDYKWINPNNIETYDIVPKLAKSLSLVLK